MEGPFYSRRGYMYGNTFFEEPVPYYNATRHHHPPNRPPRFRDSLLRVDPYEDNAAYVEDVANANHVVKNKDIPNVTNVETMVVKSLLVYIYALREEDDRAYTLDLGKRYKITYITQYGVKEADGYLRFISNAIPEECTRYIGQDCSVTKQAYIGMDCSTKGVSDKRKIFISTIRMIEPMEDDDDYVAPEESIDKTKYEILERLNSILSDLDKYGYDDFAAVSEQVSTLTETIENLAGKIVYAEDEDVIGDGQ